MNRNPLERLGSGGGKEVKAHPFFSSVDWDALYARRIPPPFDPCKNANEVETNNFEKEFTSMPLNSLDEHGSHLAKADADFVNFTYEEESNMESMRENRVNSRRK